MTPSSALSRTERAAPTATTGHSGEHLGTTTPPGAPTTAGAAGATPRTVDPTKASIRVAGWGGAVPEQRVTNQVLEATLDTSDEWIVARTGIRERRIATDDESTLPLAVAAARRALDHAAATPDSVDLVVVATCTAEQPMPSTAS